MVSIILHLLSIFIAVYICANVWAFALCRGEFQGVDIPDRGLVLAWNYVSQAVCCLIGAMWFLAAGACFVGISDSTAIGLVYAYIGVFWYVVYTLLHGLMCGLMIDLD